MKLAMDWLEFLCCVYAVADPGEVPGGHPRRYFKTGLPPYLRVWMTATPFSPSQGLDRALVSGMCRAS